MLDTGEPRATSCLSNTVHLSGKEGHTKDRSRSASQLGWEVSPHSERQTAISLLPLIPSTLLNTANKMPAHIVEDIIGRSKDEEHTLVPTRSSAADTLVPDRHPSEADLSKADDKEKDKGETDDTSDGFGETADASSLGESDTHISRDETAYGQPARPSPLTILIADPVWREWSVHLLHPLFELTTRRRGDHILQEQHQCALGFVRYSVQGGRAA